MLVLDRFRNILTGPQSDEALYEFVVDELQSGDVRKGLWAKALAAEDFDQGRARGAYVRMRVAHLRRNQKKLQRLSSELAVAQTALESQERKVDKLQSDKASLREEFDRLGGFEFGPRPHWSRVGELAAAMDALSPTEEPLVRKRGDLRIKVAGLEEKIGHLLG